MIGIRIAITATRIIPTNNLLFKNSPRLKPAVSFSLLPFSFLREFTIFTIINNIRRTRMILGQNAAPSSVAVGAGDSAPTRKKRYMQKIPNTIEKIMSNSDNLPFPAFFIQGSGLLHSPCSKSVISFRTSQLNLYNRYPMMPDNRLCLTIPVSDPDPAVLPMSGILHLQLPFLLLLRRI